jgi:hypothetical protein
MILSVGAGGESAGSPLRAQRRPATYGSSNFHRLHVDLLRAQDRLWSAPGLVVPTHSRRSP